MTSPTTLPTPPPSFFLNRNKKKKKNPLNKLLKCQKDYHNYKSNVRAQILQKNKANTTNNTWVLATLAIYALIIWLHVHIKAQHMWTT